MKIINTNPRFGYEGPFEAASFDALADEMMAVLTVWAGEGDKTVSSLREEFIGGLEEVGD